MAAQSQPSLSREYIHLDGRVLAVENQGATGDPGGGGPVRIDVWPGTVSLGVAQTQQFTAKITGTTNTAVRWSISPNVGTITSAGLYTAPTAVISGQSVAITAASEADLSKTSTATVSFYSPQVAGD